MSLPEIIRLTEPISFKGSAQGYSSVLELYSAEAVPILRVTPGGEVFVCGEPTEDLAFIGKIFLEWVMDYQAQVQRRADTGPE